MRQQLCGLYLTHMFFSLTHFWESAWVASGCQACHVATVPCSRLAPLLNCALVKWTTVCPSAPITETAGRLHISPSLEKRALARHWQGTQDVFFAPSVVPVSTLCQWQLSASDNSLPVTTLCQWQLSTSDNSLPGTTFCYTLPIRYVPSLQIQFYCTVCTAIWRM